MSAVLKAFRTELDPTVEQRRALGRAAGCARFAYNWAFAEWQRQWARRQRIRGDRALRAVKRRALRLLVRLVGSMKVSRLRRPWSALAQDLRGPSWQSLHKQLVARKRLDYPWLYEVSAFAVREAVRDLGDAYKHFFRRLQQHQAGNHKECVPDLKVPGRCKLGEPTWRSRNKPAGKGWHCMQPSALSATLTHVHVPGVGPVRLKERGYVPTSGLRGLAVRERAGRWFVSVQAEVPIAPKPRLSGRGPVGVEVGIRSLAVTSSGRQYGRITDLNGLDTAERKTKLWQRRMSRRYRTGKKVREQSKGWWEAKHEVAKYQAQGADIRRNAVHQVTTRIVRERAPILVVRENVVRDMMMRGGSNDRVGKRARMAQIVRLGNMHEFRRQLTYKQGWAGGSQVLAPSDFPSTKRCSVCQAVRADDPGYPKFTCPTCGHREDREANSARNLQQFAATNGKTPAALVRRKTPARGHNGRGNRSTGWQGAILAGPAGGREPQPRQPEKPERAEAGLPVTGSTPGGVEHLIDPPTSGTVPPGDTHQEINQLALGQSAAGNGARGAAGSPSKTIGVLGERSQRVEDR